MKEKRRKMERTLRRRARRVVLAGCALALLALAAPLQRPAAQIRDALDPGIKLLIQGNPDGAAGFFSRALTENPQDSRARELLGNCLIIAGKEALRDRKYAAGRSALAKAREIFSGRRDLEMLGLLAELEENAPAGSVAVSSASLDTGGEMNAVFECIFGNGECARGGKYLIHVVALGETMSDIAIKYYNDYTQWEKIWARNPKLLNPHRLEKGTRLVIPLP